MTDAGIVTGAAEARAEFLLRLRARGIRDRAVLNALEAVPRVLFVPHRYADLAMRDIALPIPCGQTMPEPFFAGLAVAALGPNPTSRVLEIGTGSGYVTAILAQLSGEVLSIERYAGLVAQAKNRLDAFGVGNVAVAWGDGLAIPPLAGGFDRILVHGVLPDLPKMLTARLTGTEAVVVYARAGALDADIRRQVLVRATRGPDGTWAEATIGPSRLTPLEPGLAKAL